MKSFYFRKAFYHGSLKDFDRFELGHDSKYGYEQYRNRSGFGLHISADVDRAKEYASQYPSDEGYLYKFNCDKLEDMKPLDVREVTLTTDEVTELITRIAKAQKYPSVLRPEVLDLYDGADQLDEGELWSERHWSEKCDAICATKADELINFAKNDVRIISELSNDTKNPELVGKALTAMNYGYALDTRANYNYPDVIVFDPDNVKYSGRERSFSYSTGFTERTIYDVYNSVDHGAYFKDLTFHNEGNDIAVALADPYKSDDTVPVQPVFQGYGSSEKYLKFELVSERKLAGDLQMALLSDGSEPAQILASELAEKYHTEKLGFDFNQLAPDIEPGIEM